MIPVGRGMFQCISNHVSTKANLSLKSSEHLSATLVFSLHDTSILVINSPKVLRSLQSWKWKLLATFLFRYKIQTKLLCIITPTVKFAISRHLYQNSKVKLFFSQLNYVHMHFSSYREVDGKRMVTVFVHHLMKLFLHWRHKILICHFVLLRNMELRSYPPYQLYHISLSMVMKGEHL